MKRAALVAVALATGCGHRAPAPAPTTDPAPVATMAVAATAPEPWAAIDRTLLWSRVAVLGASVSAGFSAPRVAAAVRAASPAVDDDVILDAADLLMFRDPWTDGARQVDAAIAHRPSLVLAIDFLFWYAYQPGDAVARAASLERGLAELARLEGPLAIGDLPDMRRADPRMLPPSVVPPVDELDALNRRLGAWAAGRRHTVVLPLSAWSARLAADERVELAPGEVVAASRLVFVDRLHVNALGLWWMLDQIDRQLEHDAGVPTAAIVFARP